MEIPVLVIIENDLFSNQKTRGLEPIWPSKVRSIVEDRYGGGEVPVDDDGDDDDDDDDDDEEEEEEEKEEEEDNGDEFLFGLRIDLMITTMMTWSLIVTMIASSLMEMVMML